MGTNTLLMEITMHLEPPPRSTFFTVFLPTALSLFTIAALILIFSVGDGGSPARRERPPTSEVRVEGTAEASAEGNSTVEIMVEVATHDVTEQATNEAAIEPTVIPGSRGEYTLMLVPPSERGGMPDDTPIVFDPDGFEIRAFTPASYEESIEALCNGEVDMAVLSNLAYLVAYERGCIVPGVTAGHGFGPSYTAQIITSDDHADIQTIQDIKGKRFCRYETLSSDRELVADFLLRSNGIHWETDFSEVIYLDSFESVVYGLPEDICDVGLVFSNDYYMYMPEIRDGIAEWTVILAESAPIAHEALVFSPDVSDDRRNAIVAQLVDDDPDMGADPVSLLMWGLYGWQGAEQVDDSFFDPLRQLFEAAGENVEDYVR
jgi:ABC-type phosphate/phosphonate transport system substrate-binding protein